MALTCTTSHCCRDILTSWV